MDFLFNIFPKSKDFQVSFDYEIELENNTPENLLTGIKLIFSRNFYLQNNYKKVTVLYQNPFFTVVPHTYFDDSQLSIYLDQHTKVFKNDVFQYDTIDSINAKGVYLTYSNINNFLISKLGDFDFFHQNSVLCEQLILRHSHSKAPVVHLNFLNNSLTLLVLHQNNIQLINQYECMTDADVIYYVLFVIEQLQLKINQIDFEYSGDFSRAHPYYKTITNYFNPINEIVPEKKNKQHFMDEFYASYYPLITLEA